MPSEAQKKYYVTTPIYYVNARPHIGHAYTTIVADVLARRHRLLGEDVFFLTGTDEHGQKIERSAAAAGIPPQQFADGVAASFEGLWKRMGITNDKFIRTTDPAHAFGVQKLFTELYNRGFIYLSTYTGAYCVSDEAFVDVPVGQPCPDCGRITEQVTEENFFFKLSAFQRPLIDLIETGTLAVEPESRRNEVLSFLRGNVAQAAAVSSDTGIQPEAKYGNDLAPEDKGVGAGSGPRGTGLNNGGALVPGSSPTLVNSDLGNPYVPGVLKDLSISRSSFTWGIPVPAEVQKAAGATQNHVIYVWLDALANYMTAIGYGADANTSLTPEQRAEAQRCYERYWPADLHLVGKEIIRFHCVYWPAFLLAANLPLPKAITAHGWLLFDNSKMSKSKGNIVRTETILQAFGNEVYGKQFPESTKQERDLFAADVLRYFLLREIPFGQDGSFSFEALITRYNAELANGYGNLVSRTLNMIGKYFQGAVPTSWASSPSVVTEASIEKTQLFERFVNGNPSGSWVIQLQSEAAALIAAVAQNIQRLFFNRALEACSELIRMLDAYLTDKAPWKLIVGLSEEEMQRKRGDVLYTAAESIRIITALLYPILPYATARVWAQLGLGDIASAAASGELNNLQWGGLKPGTRLGPLAPIFPRADKGLAQIMNDMENNSQLENSKLAAGGNTRPEASLKAATTPAPAAPVVDDPNHPAAPPRALDEPSGMLPVAGSHATTTGNEPTPSHTEAQPSGAFATAAAQVPITAASDANKPTDASPQITIDDFAKVELRVAEIKVCERIPKADKLLRLEVDLGPDFPAQRQILSGIAEFYTPEELLGRRIIVITNLAPRKMRGLDSHGMLLAASGPEGGKPILATVPEGVPVGSRLK